MRAVVLKKGAALFLAVSLMLLCCLPAFAEGPVPEEDGEFFAVGYSVSKSRITRGTTADISVTVKNVSLSADSFRADDYDFSKLLDSFSGGSVSVSKESSGSDPLQLRIRFSKVKYSGTGQSFRFQITRKGGGAAQTIELTIPEASISEEKPKIERDPAPDAEPIVLISCSELKEPLQAGQEAELTVSFRNLSDLELKSPVVTFSPSDSLTLAGGSYSFLLDNVKGKQTASVKVKVRAASAVSSPNQSLQADLKYTYFNNVSQVQASASEKLPVPAAAREGAAPPVVLVSRSELKNPLSPGETASITVTFRNMGDTKLVSPLASFSPSEALLIESAEGSILLADLEPGKSASVTLKVRALPEISSANQSIQTELKYSYDGGGTMTQGSSTDRLTVPAHSSSDPSGGESSEPPAPHIVVNEFSYGGDSVGAGSNFDLKFRFENKGKMAIENILLAVDGGENFTVSGGTSSFYFSSLAAGAGQEQTVPLQALPGAKSGAQSVSLSFKYEYVDAGKRASSGEDIRLAMPVVQPDRFEIRAPQSPESLSVGEESVLTLPYVNKGKGEIANVEASVEGEGIDTPSKTQYVGNIAAGSSGNIGFVFTPQEAGPLPIVIKITYEDANEKLQTKEFSLELIAEDSSMDPMFDEPLPPDEPEAPGFPWGAVLGGTGGAASIAAIVLIVHRKKKKAQADTGEWTGWEEPETESDGQTGAEE